MNPIFLRSAGFSRHGQGVFRPGIPGGLAADHGRSMKSANARSMGFSWAMRARRPRSLRRFGSILTDSHSMNSNGELWSIYGRDHKVMAHDHNFCEPAISALMLAV
jgi:hypothetical protein